MNELFPDWRDMGAPLCNPVTEDIAYNVIAPGAFSSEMMGGVLERMGDISQFFPRNRICEPAQMDRTLLYFLSPASEAVTGTKSKSTTAKGRGSANED